MNVKKMFASLTGVLMLASTLPVSVLGAASYSDELKGAYEYAHSKNITTMSSIDNANMYGELTRGQLAKMIANWAETEMGAKADETAVCSFSDANTAEGDLAGYLKKACQMGLMGQGIEKFRPNDKVTRGEFGTTLSRALWGDKYNGATPFYKNHLEALKEAGIMKMIETPNQMEIRGYVMLMLQRSAEEVALSECKDPTVSLACMMGSDTCPAKCKAKEPTTTTSTGVNKAGDLSLSVNAVADRDVSRTTNNAKAMSITVKAAGSDVTLNGITVSRDGYTQTSKVSKVFLRNSKGTIVSNERSLNSDGNAYLTIKGGLVIKAGSSETLDLYVGLDATTVAGDQFSFKVVDAKAIETSALNVAASFPLKSATLKAVNYSVETLSVSAKNAAAGGATTDVNIGEKQVEMAKLSLSLNNTNNRDAHVKTVSLKLNQQVNDYLSNFSVKMGADTVKDVEFDVNGKFLTVVFPGEGYKMGYGDTKNMYLYADVIGGEWTDTLQFSVDSDSDVVGYETSTLESLGVTVSNKYSYNYSLKESDTLLSKDAKNSPNDSYVSNDSKGNTVVVMNLKSLSKITLEKMYATVEDSSSTRLTNTQMAALFNKVAIYQGDTMIADGAIEADGANWRYKFDVYRDFSGKENELVLKVDMTKNAAAGSTFKFAFDGSKIQGTVVNTDNDLNGIVGTVNSAVFTVKKSAIKPIADAGSVNSKFVAGDKVLLANLTMAGNDINDIRINTIVINEVAGNELNKVNGLNEFTIDVNGNEITKTASAFPVSFSSLDLKVKKGEIAKVKVYANIGTTFDATPTKDDVKLTVAITDAESIGSDGSTTDIAAVNLPVAFALSLTATAGAEISQAGLNANTPSSSVIVPGEAAQPIVKYNVRPTKDAVLLKSAVFKVVGVKAGKFELMNGNKVIATSPVYAGDPGKYYVSFQNITADNELPADTTSTLTVNFASDVKLDAWADTNAQVKVTLLTDVTSEYAQGTDKTQFLGKANSADVTAAVIARLGASVASNAMYLRNTNLVADKFSADKTSLNLTIGTNNGKTASVAALPVEFLSWAGITSVNITSVKVAGTTENLLAAAVPVAAAGVTQLKFSKPITVEANGTKFVVEYTITPNATANTITLSVRVPDAGEITTAPAAAAGLKGIVWSDDVEGTPALTDAHWYEGDEIAGLSTATVDLYK